MKKTLLLIFVFLLTAIQVKAYEQPSVSNGDNVTWYLIQFSNGENVLTAQGDGDNVLTGMPTGRDTQLWKIEGSATEGYTFTSKNGFTLYTTTTQTNGMFKAGTSPNANSRFVWQTTTNTSYAGSFVILPKANVNVYMNQWAGAGSGKQLGLWNNRADANQPLRFVSIDDFEKLGQALPLIPYPAKLTSRDGKLELKNVDGILTDDAAATRYATDFARQLKRTSGLDVNVNPASASCAISLHTDASLSHETYRMSVSGAGIDIASADSAGFFYAIQTLKQLLPPAIYGTTLQASADWSVPCVDIEDQPALSHRGYMLDVARHFFSKQEVKRVLDILAAYKMNRFHWHLSDDQGWRIEIPEYPRLTEVGSIRGGSFSNAGGASKFFDDTEYGRGMWYSLQDLREIVAYAKERNIEIIPEIDLPGHMVAAVTAYPEFSCDPTKKYSVRIDGGISKDVLNIGKDEVVDFLKCVLGHVAEVFPYKYIHLGGDECPTDQWANNADCLRCVKEQGLSGVNELQSWLVEELGMFLKEKYGKDIIVWDELLAHWNSDNKVKPVIMAWNNISKSADAANKGFKSIVVPYQSLYLDMMQVPVSRADINEKYQGGWGENYVNSVETVYGVNPVASLSGREDYCLGVQGNMWTETCNDSVELEYQLLPRLLALSETGWLPAKMKNWVGFYRRLQSHRAVLDNMGYTYATHYFEEPERTDLEKAVAEAEEIIAQTEDGLVGLPAADVQETLRTALNDAKTAGHAENLAALNAAIKQFKEAEISQPRADAYYQIISASTYYKAKYAGSTLYDKNGNARFHYTKQYEPEEIWQFVPTTNGYFIKNAFTGEMLSMPSVNGNNVTLSAKGSTMKLNLATTPSGKYTYIPAVFNIASGTGLLTADCTGYVKRNTNAALCYPGTWRIKEITDFSLMLQRLAAKCVAIVRDAEPGEMGQPTADALKFLQEELIVPAQEALKNGNVSRETYDRYLALYVQFQSMPCTSIVDSLDESYYYNLRNAHFTNYYAMASSSSTVQPRTMSQNSDAYQWRVRKNANGTVSLFSKLNDKSAYPASDAETQNILLGKDYEWQLDQFTTEEGNTGIRIMTKSGNYSWYVNASSWRDNVILKPISWGASIWTFEKLNISTAIESVREDADEDNNACYDLQGRRISRQLQRGVYITKHGKKVIK